MLTKAVRPCGNTSTVFKGQTLRSYTVAPNQAAAHDATQPPLDAHLARFLRDAQKSIEHSHDGSLHSGQTSRQERVVAEDGEEEGVGRPRRSLAARYGSARIGMVELPLELNWSVSQLIETSDKEQIRVAARKMYERFRLTSSLQSQPSVPKTQYDKRIRSLHHPEKVIPLQEHGSGYDASSARAYMAGAMPSAFAATLRVFREIKRRLDGEFDGQSTGKAKGKGKEVEEAGGWEAVNLVDWGSGTGSVAWAALEVWPTYKRYLGLEQNSSMRQIADQIINPSIPSSVPEDVQAETDAEHERKRVEFLQNFRRPHGVGFLSHDIISRDRKGKGDADKLDDALAGFGDEGKQTMAVAAFTLSEIATTGKRKDLIKNMWDSGAEVIVIIDRGTPAGFQVVADAREQLLKLGRKPILPESSSVEAAEESEEDPEVLMIGGLKFTAVRQESVGPQNGEGEALPTVGSHIIAPCPHDGQCPLHRSRDFCHFTQRLQRPSFLRLTKHSKENEEDSSFSYVVVRRGHRANSRSSETTVDTSKETKLSTSPTWPRLIYPPMKRSGHVVMDVCAPSGSVERMTMTKSQGSEIYTDARKSNWGDIFPHSSRKPPIVRTRGIKRLDKPQEESFTMDLPLEMMGLDMETLAAQMGQMHEEGTLADEAEAEESDAPASGIPMERQARKIKKDAKKRSKKRDRRENGVKAFRADQEQA